MSRKSATIRLMLVREAITALGVLALVFLSFAHQPVQANLGAAFVPSGSALFVSFCGDIPDGENGGTHAPCHACRVSVGDLPPPPCGAEPAFSGYVAVAYSVFYRVRPQGLARSPYGPRAPPVTV